MKEAKAKSRRPWLVHGMANCSDCQWESREWQTAVQEARAHAKKTGHRVSVETGYAQIYNDK